jgi:hypothetical protein
VCVAVKSVCICTPFLGLLQRSAISDQRSDRFTLPLSPRCSWPATLIASMYEGQNCHKAYHCPVWMDATVVRGSMWADCAVCGQRTWVRIPAQPTPRLVALLLCSHACRENGLAHISLPRLVWPWLRSWARSTAAPQPITILPLADPDLEPSVVVALCCAEKVRISVVVAQYYSAEGSQRLALQRSRLSGTKSNVHSLLLSICRARCVCVFFICMDFQMHVLACACERNQAFCARCDVVLHCPVDFQNLSLSEYART